MNWILDRIALILTAIACALGAWAFYRYTGQWAGPIIMTVVIVGLFVENHRLRKLLAAHGIESRPRGRQKYLKALRRHDRPSSIRRYRR